MSVIYPDVTAPDAALLNRMEALIREGFSGLTREGQEWPSGQRCPYGHWLFPDGTGLYRYDLPETAEPPFLLLGYAQDGVPRNDRDSRWWDLFPCVDIVWQRDSDLEGWRRVCGELTRFFLGEFSDGEGFVTRAHERLTDGAVQAYHVRRFDVESVVERFGRVGYTLGLQVFCSGVCQQEHEEEPED